MIRLSEKQIKKVESDVKNIISNDSYRTFPESMKYSEFLDLLSKHGLSEVANYYGCSMALDPNRFAIDSEEDLPTILSYWLVRYGEDMEVNIQDLIERINEEYSIYLFQDDDPIKECILKSKNVDRKEYESLSEEDKNKMRKEIEDDKNILLIGDYIFFN